MPPWRSPPRSPSSSVVDGASHSGELASGGLHAEELTRRAVHDRTEEDAREDRRETQGEGVHVASSLDVPHARASASQQGEPPASGEALPGVGESPVVIVARAPSHRDDPCASSGRRHDQPDLDAAPGLSHRLREAEARVEEAPCMRVPRLDVQCGQRDGLLREDEVRARVRACSRHPFAHAKQR